MGKRYLHYGKTLTRQELNNRIDALTAQDLWLTAREMFVPEEMTVLIYR